MDSSWDLLLAGGCLVLGVLFRMGKCSDWLLGKDDTNRKKFKEEETMKYFSTLMFVLAACNLLSVAGAQLQNRMLMTIGIGLNIVIIVLGLVYYYKSKRFRR